MPYNINLSLGTLAELLLACALLIGAARHADTGRMIWLRAMIVADWFARRPLRMVLVAGALPVVLRLALLIVNPAPQPYVMEEFNHLFLAETYALGRVTNPAHPLAIMIQTYQQIEWPYYISARPPLPPIFLYLGVAAFGSAFAGNLIALGLTSAALCWALQGWVGGRWAAIGSFLAIVTFCLFGYWVNSYWAPTTIVLGGALLMGAVPRIEQRPRLIWALVCIVALLLLAGTRPYANGVYAAVVFGWLAVRFLQAERRPMLLRAIFVIVLPIAIGVAGIGLAQLWYNDATTGNYALMPYQIWRASQDMTPMFLWQDIAEVPVFYNTGAARFAAWNLEIVEQITQGGIQGAAMMISRHGVTFRDLLGPFLFLAFLCWSPRWLPEPKTPEETKEYLVMMCFACAMLALCGPVAGSFVKLLAVFVLLARWQNRQDRLPVLVLLIGMIATSLPTFYMNIYFAAYTAPLLILVVTGLRNLSRWNRRLGKSLAGFILLGAALVPVGQTFLSALATLGVPVRQWGPALSHFDLLYPNTRFDVLERLNTMPGDHAVLVALDEKTSAPIDPVWNAPDIDDQKVVWLREMRPDWTAAAQKYYADRTFWRMVVMENGEFNLFPYPTLEGVEPASLESLPNPDRAAAEALGAKPAN